MPVCRPIRPVARSSAVRRRRPGCPAVRHRPGSVRSVARPPSPESGPGRRLPGSSPLDALRRFPDVGAVPARSGRLPDLRLRSRGPVAGCPARRPSAPYHADPVARVIAGRRRASPAEVVGVPPPMWPGCVSSVRGRRSPVDSVPRTVVASRPVRSRSRLVGSSPVAGSGSRALVGRSGRSTGVSLRLDLHIARRARRHGGRCPYVGRWRPVAGRRPFGGAVPVARWTSPPRLGPVGCPTSVSGVGARSPVARSVAPRRPRRLPDVGAGCPAPCTPTRLPAPSLGAAGSARSGVVGVPLPVGPGCVSSARGPWLPTGSVPRTVVASRPVRSRFRLVERTCRRRTSPKAPSND